MKILTLLLTSIMFSCSSVSKLEKNKEVVKNFYLTAVNEKQPRKAIELYTGDHYKQHNPYAGDGKEPFIKYFESYNKKFPKAFIDIKRVIAEDDLVMVHVHSRSNPKDRGRAVIDIFRVKDFKVVEHWDVVQEIPKKAANDNTMF